MTAPASSSSSRPRRALAIAVELGAFAMIGYHVLEAVRGVAGMLERDRAAVEQLDEAALRRELREIGGLAPDTVETILAASRSPIA